MRVFTTFAKAQQFREDLTKKGIPLVFVPTMGALHAGHLSLVELAKQHGAVLVSIFVNPTQFTNAEDLEKYPRDTKGDLEKLEKMGVDAVFLPSEEEVYPVGRDALQCVSTSNIFSILEGAARPGHFEGVYTVLHRFFSALKPDRVVFGQKDFQQTLLVKYLCQKEFFNIMVDIAPIFREPHGLAMSSRNERLLPEDRAEAKVLYAVLCSVKSAVEKGETNVQNLLDKGREKLLKHPKISAVHYFTLVNPETLAEKTEAQKGDILLLSVTYAGIHLIDNLFL
ncbi:MAG: pantoate--beta-alanine ligase [Candidatus Peregrinibacteria bacterium]